MSSKTQGGVKNDFVTQHNFWCKVLKSNQSKKHAANFFVSSCCVLQLLAFVTSKSQTTSQVLRTVDHHKFHRVTTWLVQLPITSRR